MRALPWLAATLAYLPMVVAMYSIATPEVTGKALMAERLESHFHVAAVNLKPQGKEAKFAGYTLATIKSGKVDRSAVSFLLPDDRIELAGGDIHTITVLERHADWQLVEYRYGNTHDSVSRYRAFKDRVEPVSYRLIMHPGIIFWAFLLLVPAWLIGALVHFLLKRLVSGGRRSARP